VCVAGSCGYSHTIQVGGTLDFVAADEEFSTTSMGYSAYVTWDHEKLYIGYQGPDIQTPSGVNWVLVYLDIDPQGTDGTDIGQIYNTQQPMLPFKADWHIRWKANDGFLGAMSYVAGTGWTETTISGLQAARVSDIVELAVPLASLVGSGDPPVQIGVVTFMINEANLGEWTYAGLYVGTFTDGYDRDPASYLLVDRSLDRRPNDTLNKRP